MKIAQIAPLWFKVPPHKYGGAEMSVWLLTEALVKAGHDVSLFASGDSNSSAKIHSIFPQGIFDIQPGVDWSEITYTLLQARELLMLKEKFDILHFHISTAAEHVYMFSADLLKLPAIFTLRYRLPDKDAQIGRYTFLQQYRHLPFVSISDNQRRQIPELNWLDTVHNCVDPNIYSFKSKKQNYVVWVGEIQPPKAPHLAIQAAVKAGYKIILAGRISHEKPAYYNYWINEVKPLINDDTVTFVGETTRKETANLMQNAIAFLNPIVWDEPFGLVMIESLSCGTPVISFNRGAAPEIISDGVNGFLVNTVDEMAACISRIKSIDPLRCRKTITDQFSPHHTATKYLKLYSQFMKKSEKLNA